MWFEGYLIKAAMGSLKLQPVKRPPQIKPPEGVSQIAPRANKASRAQTTAAVSAPAAAAEPAAGVGTMGAIQNAVSGSNPYALGGAALGGAGLGYLMSGSGKEEHRR